MDINPLPFHDSILKQSRYKRECPDDIYGQPCLSDRLPRFRITRDRTGTGISCLNVWNDDDTLYQSVSLGSINVESYTSETKDYIIYYGDAVTGLNLPCGRYYLEVDGWFSEPFYAVSSVSDSLRLEWYNTSDIGSFIYSTGYRNLLYLPDSILVEPTYEYEEEAEENGGLPNVSFKKLKKVYRFDTGEVPQYIVDSLHGIPLHNQITIGGHEAQEVRVKEDWLDGSCYANVEITFSDSVITTDACPEPVVLTLVGNGSKTWLCGDDANTTDTWEDTGAVRCKSGDLTGMTEKEQRDVNPNSPTYMQTRWVDSSVNLDLCPVETEWRCGEPECK